MAKWTTCAVCLFAALALGACSDLFGGPGAPASSGTATGGATVNARVQQLRADQNAVASGVQAQANQLQALRGSIGGEARGYDSAVTEISSRLSTGTTPGNPELVSRWNQAQSHLDRITGDIGGLNSLASQVTTQASVAGHLLDTIRSTYNVGGAVDEDHRQLRQIEAEANQTMQAIDRLIGDLNGEISRQNAFLAAERANLAGLSYGVSAGRLRGAPVATGGPRPYPGRRN
ncbi:MAG: hypothetical protein KF889_02585 [Alphaproteobacteria bacterium]|nr:hypothetical protein [Alphaproteobacteria bacterium]MCW5741796.1 hypothetical protein [Alphaproteobacteria bacterium]